MPRKKRIKRRLKKSPLNTILLIILLTVSALLLLTLTNNHFKFIEFDPSNNDSKPKSVFDYFPKRGILENSDQGYKFLYPAGYKVVYLKGGVELTPPSNLGKIKVSVKDKIVEITKNTDNLSQDQIQKLNLAEELIRVSFRFLQTK